MHKWDPEGAAAAAAAAGAEPMALDNLQLDVSAQKPNRDYAAAAASAGAPQPGARLPKQQRMSPLATKKRLFRDAFTGKVSRSSMLVC